MSVLIASVPVADTIAGVALSLPVEAVFFAWGPPRFSLAKHYLLRWTGKRSSIPLDTLWLTRRNANGKESPAVLIRRAPDSR